MEHRWGERVGLDLPVRITAHPFSLQHGRLINLSVSGGLLSSVHGLRPLSRIQVFIEMPHTNRAGAPSVPAYVSRSTKDGTGIEWCEFSPPVIGELLSSLSSRRHVRLRRPEATVSLTVARLSTPLLKHGV